MKCLKRKNNIKSQTHFEMAGELTNLEDDNAILAINSPKDSVKGPYSVVFRSLEERYAIVALDWNGEPSLGIRWFWGNKGNPISTGHPIWFIYPSSLTFNLLNGLPITHGFRNKIDRFLSGELSASAL
jgi:hypothetical protein